MFHPFTKIGPNEVFINEGLMVIIGKEILMDHRMWLHLIMFRHNRVPDLEDLGRVKAEFMSSGCFGDVYITPGNKFCLEVWTLCEP
jgi:hypothetical protein